MLGTEARRPKNQVFSKILVDAPCSGLGIIRKHPDIKWRRSIDHIVDFAKLQQKLMHEASSVLMKGGRLVYSTCTIDVLENEQVVEHFLDESSDKFTILKPSFAFPDWLNDKYIRTFPHLHRF